MTKLFEILIFKFKTYHDFEIKSRGSNSKVHWLNISEYLIDPKDEMYNIIVQVKQNFRA